MSNFTTKKGTTLPLLKLKGKDYLQVAHRLVWFVEENPKYSIDILHLGKNEDSAIVKATISILDDDNKLLKQASATKSETKQGFPDFIEKAETGAIGRALAFLGYGTQFTADELEEGMRLADSPIQPAKKAKAVKPAEDF